MLRTYSTCILNNKETKFSCAIGTSPQIFCDTSSALSHYWLVRGFFPLTSSTFAEVHDSSVAIFLVQPYQAWLITYCQSIIIPRLVLLRKIWAHNTPQPGESCQGLGVAACQHCEMLQEAPTTKPTQGRRRCRGNACDNACQGVSQTPVLQHELACALASRLHSRLTRCWSVIER